MDLLPPGHRPRVAIIGYGLSGRSFHAHLIRRSPGLELYGIAARDSAVRARIVAEQNCRTFDSFDAAIADPRVDLVVIATPHDTHARLGIAALNAGKHVVTDKVMCLNATECDAMIEAASIAGRMLSVFHNRRWDTDFLTLRRAMEDGTLGDVRWIEMNWQRHGVSKSWRGDPSRGGGRLLDLGAHILDQLLVLFTSPVRGVYCRMHHDWNESPVESHAMVTLSFADGSTGICDVGTMTRSPKPRVYAVGTKATLTKEDVDPQEVAMRAGEIDTAESDHAAHRATLYTADGQRVIEGVPGRWRAFYDNIADALAGRAEPVVKLGEMRRLMGVLDAAAESARTGAVVEPI